MSLQQKYIKHSEGMIGVDVEQVNTEQVDKDQIDTSIGKIKVKKEQKSMTPNPKKNYIINEIFYSLAGEGVRKGQPSIYLRFTGCNLNCNIRAEDENQRFNCDTEFTSGRKLTLQQILSEIQSLTTKCQWIVLTGGEPLLQVDNDLIDFFHQNGYGLALETNGTRAIPEGIDFITVSPKVAIHAIVPEYCHELKIVRSYGMMIPKLLGKIKADRYYISPAFDGFFLDKKTLDWCIKLCLDNPEWSLSLQEHKLINIR